MASEIVILNSAITKVDIIAISNIQTSALVSPSMIIQIEQLSSIGTNIDNISSLIDYQSN